MQVVAGRFGDTPEALKSLADASMFTVDLKAGAQPSLPAPADRSVFLYVAGGSIAVQPLRRADDHLQAAQIARVIA